MTTPSMDDRTIESALADLTLSAPSHLAVDVLVDVGLADRYAMIESPIGPLYVAWNARGVSTVGLARDDAAFESEHRERTGRTAVRAAALPPALGARIARRIAGDRRPDIRVDLRGRSEFEQAVLRKAAEIPHGEVRPYGWIAAEIGRPKAVRAVGTALGHNPVPLIVPCHRVIRGDGTWGNYAFGAKMKTALLTLERTTPALVGSSTTRIVCRKGCAHEQRIQEGNRVVFASVEDARTVGYRPCKVCSEGASS